MLKKVEVKVSGDSSYLPGEVIDRIKFDNTNEKLVAEGKTPAVGERVLMGITKASLQTGVVYLSCFIPRNNKSFN
jgi:DNA-directed RNA polymerase subunit beta'